MKGDEVPEKLYIDFRDRAESTWRCAYTEKVLANDIEYVRRDAFIKKATNFLNYKLGDVVNVSVPGTLIPELTTRQDFIEHFKKYMKGE